MTDCQITGHIHLFWLQHVCGTRTQAAATIALAHPSPLHNTA